MDEPLKCDSDLSHTLKFIFKKCKLLNNDYKRVRKKHFFGEKKVGGGCGQDCGKVKPR